MCALFAATYPARTSALIMIASYGRRTWAPDYPWGPTPEQHEDFFRMCEREWGGPVGLEARGPSVARDERFRQWWARLLRMGASPGANLALLRMNAEVDVRHVLPAVRVPTLILHSVGDRALDVRASRYMAERIPGAKYVELPGDDHLPWLSDADAILDEVEEFLTGVRPGPEPDRVLATVLFTDIVHPGLQVGQIRHAVGEAGSPLVEEDEPRERGQASEKTGEAGFLPEHLDV